MADTTPGKCCRRCNLVKPADQFGPNGELKSGLASWCRPCHREYGRALSFDADPSITEKRCVECGSVKTVDQFNRGRRHKDGFQPRCKSCQKERHRDWYVRNSESVIARTKLWAENNPEKVKVLAQNRQRRRLYGLTVDGYAELLASQSGRCAGCDNEFGATVPHVDHDHDTGAVRGLLCGPCNKALGMALDSADRLIGLARYLGADVVMVSVGLGDPQAAGAVDNGKG